MSRIREEKLRAAQAQALANKKSKQNKSDSKSSSFRQKRLNSIRSTASNVKSQKENTMTKNSKKDSYLLFKLNKRLFDVRHKKRTEKLKNKRTEGKRGS